MTKQNIMFRGAMAKQSPEVERRKVVRGTRHNQTKPKVLWCKDNKIHKVKWRKVFRGLQNDHTKPKVQRCKDEKNVRLSGARFPEA